MGVSAILFGIFTLIWRSFNLWQSLGDLHSLPHQSLLACAVGVIEIAAGIGILFCRPVKVATIVLGIIALIFALLRIPSIVATPTVYNAWGGFFEELSQAAGLLAIYACFAITGLAQRRKLLQVAYYAFVACTFSFLLEQLFYLSATASMTPKWLPPGQWFWAIVTTIAFALAAIALLTGIQALLAARLLTAMLIGFELLLWLPAPHTKPFPGLQSNWVGIAQNLAIAGAAWVFADLLKQHKFWSIRRRHQPC